MPEWTFQVNTFSNFLMLIIIDMKQFKGYADVPFLVPSPTSSGSVIIPEWGLVFPVDWERSWSKGHIQFISIAISSSLQQESQYLFMNEWMNASKNVTKQVARIISIITFLLNILDKRSGRNML